MATILTTGPRFTITATADYKIGSASDEGAAGGFLVQIVNDNTLSATVTVKGQCHALSALGATDVPVAVPYRSIYINGSVGTGAFVTTALTTNSLIFIPASSMDVFLSVAFTSGSASVYVQPVIGSSAN